MGYTVITVIAVILCINVRFVFYKMVNIEDYCEKKQCLVCARDFWKRKKKRGRGRMNPKTRGVNTVTCSKKCSGFWTSLTPITRKQWKARIV